MKKFNVTIEEMVSQTFEVFAKNDEKAVKIAEKKYASGEFTLYPGNLVCKQMQIQSVDNNNELYDFLVEDDISNYKWRGNNSPLFTRGRFSS